MATKVQDLGRPLVDQAHPNPRSVEPEPVSSSSPCNMSFIWRFAPDAEGVDTLVVDGEVAYRLRIEGVPARELHGHRDGFLLVGVDVHLHLPGLVKVLPEHRPRPGGGGSLGLVRRYVVIVLCHDRDGLHGIYLVLARSGGELRGSPTIGFVHCHADPDLFPT